VQEPALRRVPARCDPVASDDDRQLIIQADGTHRRATTSGEASDFRTLCPPRKMLGPSLPSRMQERNPLSRVGIPTVCFCPRILIAQFTGEAKIILVV
jgi:hypothetical protein